MAFGPWFGPLRRLLTLCVTFKNWIWSFLPLLPRLTNRPAAEDVSGHIQPTSSEGHSDEIECDKVESITRDAQGQFISGGITGIVELLDDGTALKSPFPDADVEAHILDIAKEASIYRRIGPHGRLVRLLGHSRDGLVLEYMVNGDLKTYLQAHDSISTSLKLKWAYQVAEAVDLLHRNGVIHCDIKPRNLLLDATLNIKIIDFSGSSLDGSKPASGEGTRFFLPRHWKDQPTVATDLFALGSTLYEIFQGISPYEELPSDEVEKLYKQKSFPDISDIVCGNIIEQCWLSQVDSAARVQSAIGEIISCTVNADCIPRLDGLDIGQDALIDQVVSP
ncbi:kinase domain-containing protein [Aspergillus sclerotioniger CBS 115572]|uniref:Kinase domain-containing protein n=1 Tax=Aspergillus sclerotioniger CBS 115572 TaxID=1450535 RepID=A0A317WPF5_9EURO|nr:kinase domain-containing protein [Aspergillus sclerotioniger CBS 115572]PWY87142.1 kinase domain-containing protein [Aspergillus sclerotioniger CBS 115572]